MADLAHKLAILRKYAGPRFSAAHGYDLRKPLSDKRLETIDKYYSLVRNLPKKLKSVRAYTGDRFGASAGYDLRKPMTMRRITTINKYSSMVEELTNRPHKIIVPKKGTKKEIFEFTGQKTHPKFVKAIVQLPDATQKYSWEIDKELPKGSRFVLVNNKTRERLWHIPEYIFDDQYSKYDDTSDMYDEEELSPEFFADVLEEYAVKGEVYMIEAGDYHMWGSAGHITRVSEKLSQLFKQYSHERFDRYDGNSNWIGNWFRGIQVYGAGEGYAYMNERARHEEKRLKERYGDDMNKFLFRKFRTMKDGKIAEYYQGRRIDIKPSKRRTPGRKNY